ncbi:hypothetical protein AALP_AA5G176100 [Arabis alpina]|uniref:Uncharacterized protein n=1 Tax=Arabis alpina TaxID=50452 RepID=A0A087GXR7_ARAAL|nr:hypothetical protein AALP_AA5G176100 [Arabis alpina]
MCFLIRLRFSNDQSIQNDQISNQNLTKFTFVFFLLELAIIVDPNRTRL